MFKHTFQNQKDTGVVYLHKFIRFQAFVVSKKVGAINFTKIKKKCSAAGVTIGSYVAHISECPSIEWSWMIRNGLELYAIFNGPKKVIFAH